MISLTPNQLGVLAICAVRYAMGRRTYIVGDVVRILLPLVPKLDRKDLTVLRRDISAGCLEYEHDACDFKQWRTLEAVVRDAIGEEAKGQ